MGRKSRATLNRITNLNGTHDSEERPAKRQKTSSSAVPSGKENIQETHTSVKSRFRLATYEPMHADDHKYAFHEFQIYTGPDCDTLDDFFSSEPGDDAQASSIDKDSRDIPDDLPVEYGAENNCSESDSDLEDDPPVDFFFDSKGRICLKPDSPLWELIRFGDRCSEVRNAPSTAAADSELFPSLRAMEQEAQERPGAVLHERAPLDATLLSSGKQREAPTNLQAKTALHNLQKLLRPRRKTGRGYMDPDLDPYVKTRMESMQTMLNFFVKPESCTYDAWGASALQAAIALGGGQGCARRLCMLNRQFIQDRTFLPMNPYGTWSASLLVDEDLTNDINLYLMEIGKEISGQKLMAFINREDIRLKHSIDKPICERTAQRYLNELGYRWSAPKKGQYADGHEREDVVSYREQIFLPHWRTIESWMVYWSKDGLEESGPRQPGREVITWFHDETIFYAHDRRKTGWYHKDSPAKPYTKGEGATVMVADYVSAKFGWLRSPDGKRSARQVMKPGKNKDGYFSNDDICKQAEEAMSILLEYYPQYEHLFIYDNASTHLKRAPDALSARRMPKNVPKPTTNWGVETTAHDPLTGKIVYKPDGTPAKIKVRMAEAQLADGTPQPLYFPDTHERAGVFKGMAVILQERGFGDMSKVRAECKEFKCVPGATNCCCRRILYNQPDFKDVPSLLQITCKAKGFTVVFLPKFHCELNFIEQCWGYAKRIYRLNPESSREDVLERNAIRALEAVPLKSMRRFANRSYRFMDAYSRGLNGRQAAWAARKFRGHRVLPVSIMDELEKAHVV